MISLKDVAKKASVSLMTVSRAINTPQLLRAKTLQHVQKAIDELGYVPDFSARKIRGHHAQTATLGILALDTATTPFSVDILLSIEQTARSHGWNTFLVNISSAEDRLRAVNQLLSQRPDGIIYTTMGLRKISLPESLTGKNIVLANCISDDDNVASYIPDDFNGQYQAMQSVIEKGYRRPLCFYLPRETLASQPRREAVEKAWLQAGLPMESLCQYHMTAGDEHYYDLIALIDAHCRGRQPDFDVLICGNDRLAFLAYQILLTRGIRIPQQVAVLGFDNQIGIGDLFFPPLTTVQLPHNEIGRQAALHLIEQRSARRTFFIDCPLLQRQSI